MKKTLIFIIFTLSTLNAWNLYPTYPKYLQKRKNLLKDFYLKANSNKKIVALTFDDGPNKNTKALIDILKKSNTPATFFLIAKNIKKDSYKLYQNSLLSTGMHTFNHKNFDKLNKDEIDKDFRKTIITFQKNHINYSYFRPAYGVINKNIVSNLKKYNIKAILWSNDTMDWSKKYRSYNKVLENLNNGDIILMHDHATSPKELQNLIKQIRLKGFKIVKLDELLKYPSSNL